MRQISLVRHGQASFGADDYDALSSLGIEQGRILGTWLAGCGYGPDRIVTGTLNRHRQTAEACRSGMGGGASAHPAWADGAWQVDPGFDEYDHDEIVARFRPDLADRAAMRAFLAQSANPRKAFQTIFMGAMERWIEGAHEDDYREPWRVFRDRCVAAVERLMADDGARTVAVFTSGGPIAVICGHLLGLSDRRTIELNWSIVNSSVTRLHGTRSLKLNTLNNFAHLEQTGRSEIITYR